MKTADTTTTAESLVREALEKAKKLEHYHAFISLCETEAIEQAKIIDQKISAGEKVGLLAGVPYAIKDNFLSPIGSTTAASKMLENFRSPITATVIKKLTAADAIIIGRTNLDAFAQGSSTENSYFGPTLNSCNQTRVAGGSSGGSAVAVALGIVPFALGSDTGGSIRQPAAWNGVVGFKPTFGAVSRYGVVSMGSSLDVIGVLASDADTADTVMHTIAGQDQNDPATLKDFYEKSPETGKKLRIGLQKSLIAELTDPETQTAISKIAEKLQSLGHEVVEVDLPTSRYSLAIYNVVMSAESSSNFCRYDGIRFGYRAEDANNLATIYKNSRSTGFMPENKRRILLGNYIVSTSRYEKYYLKAQKVRTLVIAEYEKTFKNCDLILTAVTASVATRLGEKPDSKADQLVTGASISGLPAISIPAGTTKDGLTIGAQLIGPRQSDNLILRLARKLA